MDAEAEIETHWRSHHDYLWRVAWLIVGDADAADDVLAAAFERAYRNWRPERIADPRAYLRRAVVNGSTDYFRRRSRDRRWLGLRTAEGRGGLTVEDQAVDRTVLTQALGSLPADQRAVIILRYWADLSVAETADALHLSEGTVKSRSSRALRVLGVQLRHSHT